MTRNQERAEKARLTLQFFDNHNFELSGFGVGDEEGVLLAADWPDVATDLLANMMHLAGTEFVLDAFYKARGHYELEVGCPGCRGMIADLDELCDTCQIDPACVRGGGA